jgi:hypothetical protein
MGELLSEGYTVINGEGEEDGFHLEAIAIGQSVHQMQVADACLVVEVPAVEEGRRGQARLLPEEVVADAGKVASYFTRLAICPWR